MEKMPYRPELDPQPLQEPAIDVTCTDWRRQLPTLIGSTVTLRELRLSDAPALYALLTTQEVTRFISPPPASVEGFERFIAWTHRQRAAGQYICFAVTAQGFDTAVGIIQMRSSDAGFATAEWGFALGSPFWGTGLFRESAQLVLEFAFETLGVHRLEARAALKNGRGRGALQKLGAVQEAVLRKSFVRDGQPLDQALYTLLDDDWRASREVTADNTIVHIH